MEQILLGEGGEICHGRGIPIQNIRKHSQRAYDLILLEKAAAHESFHRKKERKCSIFLTLSWTCRENN